MTAISVAVVWLVVGFVVAMLFGTAAHKSRREPSDDAVPERRGADVRYLRRQMRTAVAPRKQVAKRHAAA